MVKRKDGNEMEENRDKDTRRWQQQDNNGHIPGSNLANSNEMNTEELRKAEDKSSFNKLDDRGKVKGDERGDLL